MSRLPTSFSVAGVTILLALIVPSRVPATTVQVPPGNGTLQAAIDAAADGTTLVLSPGTYTGAVSITKPLRIKCSAENFAIIDAGCASSAAVTIAADGVQILGHAASSVLSRGFKPILIRGGTDVDFAVTGTSKVKLSGIVIAESCFTEQYGLDVDGTDRLKVKGVSLYTPKPVSEPSVTSARFTNIPANARVVVDHLALPIESMQSGSLLVQDSGGPMRRAGIKFSGIQSTDLQLTDAAGMTFRKSVFTNVAIDAASSDNEFVACSASSFTDSGTGDCGSGNSGFTLPSCR